MSPSARVPDTALPQECKIKDAKCKGVWSEPGTVEIIDLAALKTVATVDVVPQAAGIDFGKIEKMESKK